MSPALQVMSEVGKERKGGVRILVVAGSSGGHIFPAVSFIETLKAKYKDVDILLVLPQKNILKQADSPACRLKYIAIQPIKLCFSFDTLKGLFKLIKASFKAVFILIDFKPDLVVGFGSLISVPVILSAWLFRVTTVIHEQNVLPGRANRLLAKFSDKIAVSFKETEVTLKGVKKKIVFTGNPMRGSLIRLDKKIARDYFALDPDKFTILVMGGSQGSQRINEEFLKFASDASLSEKLQVIHLSGSKDYNRLKQGYEDLSIKFKLFSFLGFMEYAYSACDCIVSRAGATTIAEIIYFKIPAVIIPYPYAYKHQLSNAKVLEKNGCAVVIEDNELNVERLKQVLVPLIDNPEKMENMRLGYGNFSDSNADEKLAELAMSA